jgi:hypothetical protein
MQGIPPMDESQFNAPAPRGAVAPPTMSPMQGNIGTSQGISVDGPMPAQPAQQGVMINGVEMPIISPPMKREDVQREGDKSFSQNRTQDDLNATFSSALYNIQKGGAGVGSYMKDVPFVGGQTSAGNLEADLNKIGSKAALDKIAQLKAESKTGGFFGNLSDGERQAVADSVIAIRQTMDPQELAYRVMMHQDVVNDIIHGRGKTVPGTNQMIPSDAGAPRTGLPTMNDIQNAQSPEQLMQMWDVFDKYPVFKGRPPQMIDDALADRMNKLRGGR